MVLTILFTSTVQIFEDITTLTNPTSEEDHHEASEDLAAIRVES